MCHQKTLQLVIYFLLACGNVAHGETLAVQLGDAREIEFLDVETAANRLSTSDVFTKTTEALERQFRLQSHTSISEQQLLTFAGEQALTWDEKETASLRTIIDTLGGRITKQKWKVPFPQRIEFIKTTGKEEGEAAYCRGNVIILSKKMLHLPPNRLKRLIAHELFHILSRRNPELRDKLFHIVGFARCSSLRLPDRTAEFSTDESRRTDD